MCHWLFRRQKQCIIKKNYILFLNIIFPNCNNLFQDGPPRSKYLSPNYRAPASQISSNGSAQKGNQSQHRGRTNDKNHSKDQSNPDSSLLKYFAENPPVEEEVDIDFALNEHGLDQRDSHHQPSSNHYPVILYRLQFSMCRGYVCCRLKQYDT